MAMRIHVCVPVVRQRQQLLDSFARCAPYFLSLSLLVYFPKPPHTAHNCTWCI